MKKSEKSKNTQPQNLSRPDPIDLLLSPHEEEIKAAEVFLKASDNLQATFGMNACPSTVTLGLQGAQQWAYLRTRENVRRTLTQRIEEVLHGIF